MIFKDLRNLDEKEIDCSNCFKLPLIVDLNVKNSESISTLNQAGLNGGVGTFLMIPKTKPITNKLHLEYNLSKAKRRNADILVAIEGITDGKLNNISQLVNKGAKAIFINSDENMNLVRRVFEYGEMLNTPVFVNCFNNELASEGVMNDSHISYLMGVGGISNYVESVEVSKILELSKYFKTKVIFQGISTKESIEILKNRKDNIFVDVNIDNLLLSDEDIENFDTNYKTMPPLRSSDDREILLNAVKNEEIDFISSNHISVPQNQKDMPFEEAEYGISKLDVFAELVYSLDIKLETITKLVSYNPAKLFNIDLKDSFMIIELKDKKVDKDLFLSKGKNTPYKQTKIQIREIIKNGKIILRN